MKLSSLVLAVTLAANAALAVLFISGSPNDLAPPIATHPKPRAVAAPSAGDATAVDSEIWTSLQPESPASMLARLRAEGFPPALIRAIIAEQVRVQFAPRRAALNLKEKERPFWEPRTLDPKTEAERREILKEQNQALKDLLGPDTVADEKAVAQLRRQFPNWSDDNIAVFQRARQITADKQQAAFALGSVSGVEIAVWEKDQRAEMAKVLTPQELEDYDLRLGNIASNLRYQLIAFNPTEQEFRTLFQLQRDFDEKYPVSGPRTIEDMRARMTHQQQLTEQIEATLGEERFADYQRSIDGNYQQISRLIARLELPPQTTEQVFAVQQDFQQRLRTLQTDRTLGFEARNAQLGALAAEAQSKITATLGPTGYEAYKQYGGSWMQQLQPRPAPPPRPAGAAIGARGGGGGG